MQAASSAISFHLTAVSPLQMTTSAHPFPLPSVRFFWAFRSGSVAFPFASAFFPLGLCFLSSASASVSVTQLTVLPFSSLPGSPHSGSPVLRDFFRCPGLSPFRVGWFPIRASRFCLLSFLFVSFRPSLLRSRSRSTGDCPRSHSGTFHGVPFLSSGHALGF